MNELETTSLATPLDLLIMAWIAEKKKHSDSERTEHAYRTTIDQFRGALRQTGLDLDSATPNDLKQITMLAQAYAGFSATGRQVSGATYNQRLAILSSFYRFAIQRDELEHNPIVRVKRASVQHYRKALPLTAEQLGGLDKIDRSTLLGKRDYALLAMLLDTGRRLAEVQALDVRHVQPNASELLVIFERAKGNKTMVNTLSEAAAAALNDWLTAYYGAPAHALQRDARPLFVVLANTAKGQRLGPQAIADICQKWLGTSKVHSTRHTWAHAMDAEGANVTKIQAHLGHKSLATTGEYLSQLSRAENPYANQVASRLNLKKR